MPFQISHYGVHVGTDVNRRVGVAGTFEPLAACKGFSPARAASSTPVFHSQMNRPVPLSRRLFHGDHPRPAVVLAVARAWSIQDCRSVYRLTYLTSREHQIAAVVVVPRA